jgi:hypothetical protein
MLMCIISFFSASSDIKAMDSVHFICPLAHLCFWMPSFNKMKMCSVLDFSFVKLLHEELLSLIK